MMQHVTRPVISGWAYPVAGLAEAVRPAVGGRFLVEHVVH